MKKLVVLAFVFLSVNAQAAKKVRTQWQLPPQNVDAKYFQNNVRIFPFSYWSSALHIAYERALSLHWALGIDGYLATRTSSGVFYGDPLYYRRENYIGLLGQYYLKEVFDGFHIEGGLSYIEATIEPFIGEGWGAQSSYLMPHLVVGYRFPKIFGVKGLNFAMGLGVYTYLFGEKIVYRETNGRITETEYEPGTPHLRGRFDIGYSF